LNKKDLIKLVVVAIVLIFIIETFFMFGMGGTGSGTTGVNAQKGMTGNAKMNASVVSYSEELTVFGEGKEIAQTASELEREGIIAYRVSETGDQRVYRLTSSRNVYIAAERFFAKNATVLASALIQLPAQVDAIDASGKHFTAIGTSFTYKIAPDFDAGAVMPLSGQITTNENGEVSTIGNIQIDTQFGRADVVGTVERVMGAAYVIAVPFEKRVLNKTLIDENAEGMNYSFSERSYAISLIPLSSAQTIAITAKNLPYVTNIAASRISVKNDFVDSARFASDIGAGFVFPNSTIEIRFDEGKDNESKVMDFESALGISSLPSRAQKAIVSMPARFTYGGREYWFSGNSTQVLSGQFEEGQNVTLDVSFVSMGRRIVAVNKAEVKAG
jgi:hypothetical protein